MAMSRRLSSAGYTDEIGCGCVLMCLLPFILIIAFAWAHNHEKQVTIGVVAALAAVVAYRRRRSLFELVRRSTSPALVPGADRTAQPTPLSDVKAGCLTHTAGL